MKFVCLVQGWDLNVNIPKNGLLVWVPTYSRSQSKIELFRRLTDSVHHPIYITTSLDTAWTISFSLGAFPPSRIFDGSKRFLEKSEIWKHSWETPCLLASCFRCLFAWVHQNPMYIYWYLATFGDLGMWGDNLIIQYRPNCLAWRWSRILWNLAVS